MFQLKKILVKSNITQPNLTKRKTSDVFLANKKPSGLVCEQSGARQVLTGAGFVWGTFDEGNFGGGTIEVGLLLHYFYTK